MSFCLPIDKAQAFLNSLKDGTIDPEKLIGMSSPEQRAIFEDIVGKEDAKDVNALLESKLLLKDQKRGMVSWAKKVSGITEPARRDMIARIEKMDKVFDPKDERSFLADLASTKLGTDITFEEAKTMASLSHRVSESEAAIKPSDPDGSPAVLKYGADYVALQNYVHDLKLSNADTLKDTLAQAKTSPRRAVIDGLSKLAGLAKGLKASFDNSFGGRQGFKAIFTNPTLWAKDFAHSFEYLAKQVIRKPSDNRVMDAIKADIFSRQNARNGTYAKMKLDVGLATEEAYPTTLPERIPGIGRLYKASEVAYNGMAIRLRADIADQVLKIAENSGHDLMDKLNIESLGRLVNSLTGRGSLGGKESSFVNAALFSPKSLKASFDFLTLHAADEMSAYSRVQAAKNLLKVTAGIATIMATANALMPGSVETDPRSADFGKIKVGDTRFDISGGMLSLVTLAARLVTMSSKSSTTGKISAINARDKNDKPMYGATTGLDVAITFATNKASPLASLLLTHLKGENFDGSRPSVASDASNLLMPLPITNVQELISDPNAANPVLAEMLDAIGFVTNTYATKPKR